MRAALGFGWLVWRRGRVAYALALASAVLAYAVGQTALAPYALPFGSVYFACAALGLLATLSFADSADVAALASGYPRHLLLLPLRSAALAAWPLLLGSLALASAWVAFAAVALAPRFGLVAVVVPALGLVALLASLQAAAWAPLPLPFLRSVVVLLGVGLLALWGSLAFLQDLSPAVVGVGYGLAALGAFVLATRGVAQARRGGVAEWSLALRRAEGPARRPFRSPMEAQVWIELRRNGLGLPAMSAFVALLYALPTILARLRPPTVFGELAYDPALPLYLIPPVLIAALSGFDGCCVSVGDNFRPDFSLVPILAARPMSDAALVEAKLRMAAWAVLRGGAILAVGPLLLLLNPLAVAGASTSVGAYLASHATPRGFALALLAVVAFFLYAWRGATSAMWLRLSHRSWLRNGVGIALPILLVLAVPFVWLRSQNDPSLLPSLARFVLPALAVSAGLKAVAALAVARRLRTLGLVPDRTLVRWPAVALGVGIALFAAFRILLPSLPLTPLELALALFLLLPLVRVGLSVLVLHENRHRGALRSTPTAEF